ncbi:MAG: ABC transporter permease subunit [Kiritimatiellae bacterium]|nr:ABC transporter permease subunit [Kiritimatiellia bacterium]
MLGEIIRKEILQHLMSLRFAVATVLCFVVVLCSLFVRLQDYALTMDDYAQNTAEARATIKEEITGPWRIVFRGITVHQPPNPMKVFVRGVDTANGLSVNVRGHDPVEFQGDLIANPLVPLFPAMDLVTFLGVIMSLLAIVFGYDAICGEKQRGTLRLVLSYGLPRDQVLIGKWIGGLITLLVPLMVTLAAAAIVVLAQTNLRLSQSQWLTLMGITGLGMLYIGVVFSLSLWVSCLTPRPSTSIVMLVTLWLVAVMALPNLSPYLAQSLRPVPDAMQVESARTLKTREIWTREIDDKIAVYNRENGFTKEQWWDEVDWNDNEGWKRGQRRWMFELECWKNAFAERMRAWRKMDEDFERHLDSQIRLSRRLSRISPFACLAMATVELTDTGLEAKRHAAEQIRDYQELVANFGFREWLLRDQQELELHGTGKELPKWPTPENPIPQFSYVPPAVSVTRGDIAMDVAVLAGLLVVFLMLSYVTFLRYDVR